MIKKRNFLARFVFVLILVFFVSQFVVPAQGQSSEDRILAKLNLKEGMSVADVGAGNGQFSVKMARLVGTEGHVYANEIDEYKIQRIKSRIDEAQIENITVIQGEEEDAVIPDKVDFIVLKYVYHHLDSPHNFMKNLRKYLNPDGQLALIAVDINQVSSERANRRNRDPCISDPEETKRRVEKSGFQFVKKEEVQTSRGVNYILFFKASESIISSSYQRH